MKKILALLLIMSLLIGGASGAKKILYGDERALTTDVSTDTTGKGVVIAALNGLQTDVDALEAGTIDALVTEDINCTDDAVVADDLEVGGDLAVTGSASIGGGYIASGVISDDLQFAAGKDLTCAAGASEFDLSSGTGIFKTTTGAITIGGGTNGVTLNGPVTGADAKSWTMVGASTLVVGSTGIDSDGGTINLLDQISGTSATFSSTLASGAQTVTGGVTASGTVQAEQITSTDDMTVNDDLTVIGDMTLGGSFSTDDLVASDDLTVGDDGDVVGSFTAGDITSDSTIAATTTVSAEQITSTDDATVADTLTADDLVSTNDTTVGGALDVDGATTLDGLTVAEASTFNEPIVVDKAIGTAPFTITSTTVVANLNVDQVDGLDSTALVLVDGSQELTADWDAGSYLITAQNFTSDIATGTAPFTVASTTVVTNLNADSVDGKNSTDFCLLDGTQALTADWDVGDFDLQMTDLRVDEDATVSGNLSVTLALDVDGDTTLDGLTVAEAAAFSSTIDVDGNSDLDIVNISETLDVDGNTDLDLLNVSETLDVDGATTLDGVTVAEAATFSGPVIFATLTKSANYTILDTDPDVYFVGNNSGTMTLTFPTAADNTGRIITVIITTAPGEFDVVLDGENAETVDQAATKTNTDAEGDMYQLICDGDEWQEITHIGTWT